MSISLQLFLFTCFALFGASASYSVAEEISQPLQIEAKSASSRAIACEEKKMDFVLYSDDTGSVCEPRKNTDLTTKIVSCLSVGMEAVLIPDRMGVVCTRPFLGEPFLEKEVRYAPPNMIDSKSICDQQNTPSADKRILDLRFIKELLRKSQSAIDSTGIRIIGGIYCDGVDLSGLDIPFSLILDRSVFMGRVNVRNFRSKGDFSIDESVLYGSLRINRSDISGSVYASFAFIRNMDISDSVVSGSIKLNNSFVFDLINIENVSVVGDLDISTSFVSNLEVLKDKIGGALDLSQSQARCSYDIRKNEIGDMVAVKLGFGSVNGGIHTFKDISTDVAFGRPLPPARRSKDKKALADPYTQYGDLASQTARVIQETKACDAPNLIKPGTFLIGDNHIKSSLCIRNWLTDPDNNPQKSNIYLNEDNISGATWLNIIQRQAEPTGSGAPSRSHSSDAMLSIFNVKTGTLVLNFDVTAQNVSLTVNGLHFERIYDSKADCESALSARSSGSVPTRAGAQASKEILFPPQLQLPKTEQIIDWINKNKFAGTQQPFAEFVAVFERAGDLDGAKDLKIRAASAAFKSSLCELFGVPWFCPRPLDSNTQVDAARSEQQNSSSSIWSTIEKPLLWCEKLAVAGLDFILSILADYGYRPERIGWFVAITVFGSIFVFPYWLGIVGYTVEVNRDKVIPIRVLFIFDRMLPTIVSERIITRSNDTM